MPTPSRSFLLTIRIVAVNLPPQIKEPMMPRTASALADCDDFLTRFGSGVLADHINTFWAARGAMIFAERYELPAGGGWGVRSNLVNGLPAKKRKVMRRQWGAANALAERREAFLG